MQKGGPLAVRAGTPLCRFAMHSVPNAGSYQNPAQKRGFGQGRGLPEGLSLPAGRPPRCGRPPSQHRLPGPSAISGNAECKEHFRKQAKPQDAHFQTVFHIARAWTKNIDTKKQFTLGCIAPLILGQNSPLKSMILKCSMWF